MVRATVDRQFAVKSHYCGGAYSGSIPLRHSITVGLIRANFLQCIAHVFAVLVAMVVLSTSRISRRVSGPPFGSVGVTAAGASTRGPQTIAHASSIKFHA
jgi:hypothetical protein